MMQLAQILKLLTDGSVQFMKKKKLNIRCASLKERIKIASPTIDLVTVLGKGSIKFDNNPISLINDENRRNYPNSEWEITPMERGSLFLYTKMRNLFLLY